VKGVPVKGHLLLETIQRLRTFAVRVTLAAVLACLSLNVLVTDAPRLTDVARWPAALGTALALFGVSYLAVCGAELLLSLVIGPPRSAPPPGAGDGAAPTHRRP
jgi:hypothetical protein